MSINLRNNMEIIAELASKGNGNPRCNKDALFAASCLLPKLPFQPQLFPSGSGSLVLRFGSPRLGGKCLAVELLGTDKAYARLQEPDGRKRRGTIFCSEIPWLVENLFPPVSR